MLEKSARAQSECMRIALKMEGSGIAA